MLRIEGGFNRIKYVNYLFRVKNVSSENIYNGSSMWIE